MKGALRGNNGDDSVMSNTCKSNLGAPLAAKGRMWPGVYCKFCMPSGAC